MTKQQTLFYALELRVVNDSGSQVGSNVYNHALDTTVFCHQNFLHFSEVFKKLSVKKRLLENCLKLKKIEPSFTILA